MQQRVTITGAKRSKGEMEGRPYDSTKIYVQTKMNVDSGDMMGFATTEYNWGLSDNFDKLLGLKFPIQADVDMELITSGKSSKIVVLEVTPIPVQTQITAKA